MGIQRMIKFNCGDWGNHAHVMFHSINANSSFCSSMELIMSIDHKFVQSNSSNGSERNQETSFNYKLVPTLQVIRGGWSHIS